VVSFRGQIKLQPDSQIGLLEGFNSNFPMNIPDILYRTNLLPFSPVFLLQETLLLILTRNSTAML